MTATTSPLPLSWSERWTKEGWVMSQTGTWSHPATGKTWAPPPIGQPAQLPSRLWVCSVCSSSNWSKKACVTCGCKKDFKSVLNTPAGASPPQAQGANPNSVSAKLAVVADRLLAATSSSTPAATTAGTPSAFPPAASANVDAPVTMSKEGHKEAIKQIEGALACIPGEENAPLREVMSAKLVVHRQALVQAKPIGQRLDGCRAALGRARGRLTAAEDAARLAEESRVAASEEVNKLLADLAVLEAQLVEHGGEVEDDSLSPLAALQQQLHSSVLMLKEIDGMDPEVIHSAESECATIMSKFEATVDAMKQRAVDARAAAKRRHSTKSPLCRAEIRP